MEPSNTNDRHAPGEIGQDKDMNNFAIQYINNETCLNCEKIS